jgi:hypothetical protein
MVFTYFVVPRNKETWYNQNLTARLYFLSLHPHRQSISFPIAFHLSSSSYLPRWTLWFWLSFTLYLYTFTVTYGLRGERGSSKSTYCRVSLKTWRVIDNPALNMHSPLSPPLKGVKGTWDSVALALF